MQPLFLHDYKAAPGDQSPGNPKGQGQDGDCRVRPATDAPGLMSKVKGPFEMQLLIAVAKP